MCSICLTSSSSSSFKMPQVAETKRRVTTKTAQSLRAMFRCRLPLGVPWSARVDACALRCHCVFRCVERLSVALAKLLRLANSGDETIVVRFHAPSLRSTKWLRIRKSVCGAALGVSIAELFRFQESANLSCALRVQGSLSQNTDEHNERT